MEMLFFVFSRAALREDPGREEPLRRRRRPPRTESSTRKRYNFESAYPSRSEMK